MEPCADNLIRRAVQAGPLIVVTCRQKLLAAGLVLAAGVGLSWPLRRGEPLPSARLSVTPSVAVSAPSGPTQVVVAAEPSSDAVDLTPPSHDDREDPFANAPAAALTTRDDASVFSTVSNGSPIGPAAVDAGPAHQIHVVHEGDSLGRLAKRYLGDEGRALELFDLNRDVLDNPHVLRIGVELRVPSTDAADH
jgi:nucleoid-associated protein YgaU